ncbi:hypothetical protein GCM10027052_03200 [Parafrigoribacterium mesophilum]|uniref:hypothetical protein n=1 Tax=Parafrigoribacterium mesophilum TaxID=433646 RepID=UPI0031FDE2A8
MLFSKYRSAGRDVYAPNTADLHDLVYELVRTRLTTAIGRDGSFAVAVRHPDDDDAFFSEVFADSIARDIAASLAATHSVPVPLAAPRLVA